MNYPFKWDVENFKRIAKDTLENGKENIETVKTIKTRIENKEIPKEKKIKYGLIMGIIAIGIAILGYFFADWITQYALGRIILFVVTVVIILRSRKHGNKKN